MPGDNLFSDSWHLVAERKLTLRPDIRVHRQVWRNRDWFVIGDPYSNKFFRLRPRAWRFARQLDGRSSLNEIWKKNLSTTPESTPGQEEVIRLIVQLSETGLLQSDQPGKALPALQYQMKQRQQQVRSILQQFLFFRIPIMDPDPLLKKLLPMAGVLFNRWGLMAWMTLVVVAVVQIIGKGDSLFSQSEGVISVQNLPWLYFCWIFIKLFHECGHGLISRWLGGPVHTLGIMLLVFTPVPFVDATAAWGFRERWKRILTGAGGMLFELTFAAIAAIVWANTHDDFIHQLAFNMMFIASVSTVLFNANPLLKFDGYYIFSDLLDLPNLQQRSRLFIRGQFERIAFGMQEKLSPADSRGEAVILGVYGLASGLYRIILFIVIIAFVSKAFLGLGMLLAIPISILWFVVPTIRYLSKILFGAKFSERRTRVWGVSAAAAAIAAFLLFVLPVPASFTTEGIMQAERTHRLINLTGGWFERLESTAGEIVSSSAPIMHLSDPLLDWESERLEASREETSLRLKAAYDGSPALLKALELQQEAHLQQARKAMEKEADLKLTAPITGTLLLNDPLTFRGKYFTRGTEIGEILDFSKSRFYSIVSQTDASRLFQGNIKSINVKLQGLPFTVFSASIVQINPAEKDDLPDAGLGVSSGGTIPTRLGRLQRNTTREPFFSVILEMAPSSRLPPMHIIRGKARFTYSSEPLGLQWIRRVRQVLLDRYRS